MIIMSFLILLFLISFMVFEVYAVLNRRLDLTIIHMDPKKADRKFGIFSTMGEEINNILISRQMLENRLKKKSIECLDGFRVPVHWAGAIAGALSCSLSHVLLLPIDVLKTKIQSGAHAAISIRDLSAVLHGVSPTLTGYFLQGGCKFGFYEYFKGRVLSQRSTLQPLAVPVLIACSGVAELIASFMLCPLEVTKIYMLSNPDAAMRGRAELIICLLFINMSLSVGMAHCMRQICVESGPLGLFRGLPWVLLRQLPYTCVKLSTYDVLLNQMKQRARERSGRLFQRRSNKCKGSSQDSGSGSDESVCERESSHLQRQELRMQLLSGVCAGMLAAVVSNPADVILSKICTRNPNLQECVIISSVGDLMEFVRSLGWAGCVSGLPERCVMVTSLTTLQFASYERIKAFVRTQSQSYGSQETTAATSE